MLFLKNLGFFFSLLIISVNCASPSQLSGHCAFYYFSVWTIWSSCFVPGDAEAQSLQLGFGELGSGAGISASPAPSGEKERSSFRQGFLLQWRRGSPSGEIPLPTDSASPKTNLVYRKKPKECKSLISGSCGKASSLRNSL